MNVVLMATGRLPRSYFATVRTDLGDVPDLHLDVVAWAPPREHPGNTVRRYILVGPGRMPPAAPVGVAEPAGPPAPQPAASSPVQAAPAPPRAQQGWSPRRIAGGLRRRVRGAQLRVKKSGPWSTIRKLRTDETARAYWARVQSRPDALEVVAAADIVIALDARAVRAGWHLARRPNAPKVVLGVQAAVRERAADGA